MEAVEKECLSTLKQVNILFVDGLQSVRENSCEPAVARKSREVRNAL